jgi:isopenicillin N synthase-like dioxygenase
VSAGDVPLIDVGPWGTNAFDDGAIAQAMNAAATEVGFFQVVGHGVTDHVIRQAQSALGNFFARPLAEKVAFVPPRASVNRGYAPPRSESLAYSLGVAALPDLFEAFNVGPDVVVDDEVHRLADESMFAPNIWPEESHFRHAVVAYFEAARAVAHLLTEIFARALELPSGFFEPFTDHSTDLLRANHYALAPGEEPVSGQFGMGPHTDYGIVTVLYAERVAGLELLDSTGVWRGVIPEPGALLVNLGDLLARWTNDRWKSTLHRVQPPARSAGHRSERNSMAFFHDGNYDARISCLASCVSDENPARYEEVAAGEHLRAKLLGPRTMTPSTASQTAAGRAIDSA